MCDENVPTFTFWSCDVQNKQGERYLMKYTEQPIKEK